MRIVGETEARGADNGVEIQVFAGMRSGHHAIIHWILCHFQGVTLFRNNVYGAEHFVYRGASEEYQSKDGVARQPKACYLFNIEDRPVDALAELLDGHNGHLSWGSSARVVRVLVLRDLLNFMASRVQGLGQIPGYINQDWPALWRSHALEFVGTTAHLPEAVLVSYNDWVRSPDYRRALSERLGLEFSDEGLDKVPRIGAGSSFDGLKYDGRAQEMRVFDRWQSLREDPGFRRLVSDPELRRLSAKIFGIPESGAVL